MHSGSQQLPSSVAGWLSYIESLHPAGIAMGLSRVQQVASRLNFKFNYAVITVGGTNGKGSTCAMLERVYCQAGYQVGCYTSPHLLRYHERVRLQGQSISDDLLCQAFAAVESARAEVALTYFEMGTLAALWAFEQAALDVVVLEVGLGGRLDAVNIVDADCAIVTNVDLDHMEFLGDTREAIGFEKAGIYRPSQIAICGDLNPPQRLIQHAAAIGVALARNGETFAITPHSPHAMYRDDQGTLTLGNLALQGEYQWQNAASVLYAVRRMHNQLPVSSDTLVAAIQETQVIGRFQYWQHAPDIILDVAHNPHAARALRQNIQALRQAGSQIYAVFSMLADKDIQAVVATLHTVIDEWAIAPIAHPRAASASQLVALVSAQAQKQPIQSFATLPMALSYCYNKATINDKIIVFGSFFTVAAILELKDVSALPACHASSASSTN